MPLATVPVTPVLDVETVEVAGPSQWPDGYRRRSAIQSSAKIGGKLLLLAIVAVLVDGYHPFSEDAGIYVAGIKNLLHPGIYGTSAAFITPYFRFSLFPLVNALILQAVRLPLDYVLLMMQIGTTCMVLFACRRLACRCFARQEAQWGATALVAACLSVPVAGSSLSLMDPYLTGRSLSTPLTLLAICTCLDRKPLWVLILLALTAMCHPLMSIYSIGFVLLLWATLERSWLGVLGLGTLAFAAAFVLQSLQRANVESGAYLAAVETRSYYFLYRWRWYELIGAAAPLVLLAAYHHYCRRGLEDRHTTPLVRTCLLIGPLCVAISLVFARPASSSHLIAALQTIRPFLIIYFCMFLLLGGLLGQFVLKRVYWRWASFFLLLGGSLAFCQHLVYPGSPQLELPWASNTNSWTQAFLWIRSNTPPDAIVALDSNYIHAPDEDAQGFRAIAERASLADQSKDGGAAAAFPQLADRWLREQSATTNLNQIDDAERIHRLAPFHVSWIVLNHDASTSFPCPFTNDAVKVCQLP